MPSFSRGPGIITTACHCPTCSRRNAREWEDFVIAHWTTDEMADLLADSDIEYIREGHTRANVTERINAYTLRGDA